MLIITSVQIKTWFRLSIRTCLLHQAAGEHSLLLTLTDGHLGEDNFITQPLLILVEDANDNSPVFVSIPQGRVEAELGSNDRPHFPQALSE